MKTAIRLVGGHFQRDIDGESEFQDIDLPCYGEKRACILQRYMTYEEAEEVYRSQQMIRDNNIAKTVHLFVECGGTRFYLSVVKEGTQLREFVWSSQISVRSEFFRLSGNTAVALSPLYVSLLRGLINGIKVLQQSTITARLSLDDIYLVTDNHPPRWVLLRGQNQFDNQNTLDDDWLTLAATLRELNGMLASNTDTDPDPVHYQMESLIRMLENANREAVYPEKLLNHPIFWCWMRRKDLILHLAEVFKILKWNFSREVIDAFENWEVVTMSDTNLKYFYVSNWNYINRNKDKGKDKDKDKEFAMQCLLLNRRATTVRSVRDYICFMRNSYCHFFEKKPKSKDTGVTIKDIKGLENLFHQNFPKLVYVLATEAATMEEQVNPDYWPITMSIP